MSSNINCVMLSGYLTRDPELRQTTSGMSVLSLGLAVNDRRKASNGEWEDVPNWIDCTIFGARADALSRILAKGSKVAVMGRLHYSSWDKDGQKRSKIDVIVNEIELMSGGGSKQSQPGPVATQPRQARQAYALKQQQPEDVYDDQIPF